jgi:FtsP/CotA-like multicopper oxidase with cupredoxin domain
MQRRKFLKLGGASVASAALGTGLINWAPRAEAAVINKTYYITAGTMIMPDGVSVYLQGFSDSSSTLTVPGSSIVCQEGDTLNISVVNRLTKTHNFVIAGLRTGDPAKTNDAPLASTGNIAPGATGSISLNLLKGMAGTYMFYDNVTPYNRYMGLHGAIGIMPSGAPQQLYAGSPAFVHQLFWVFNDIDPRLNSAVQTGGAIPTSLTPRYFTINGLTSIPPRAVGNGDPNRDAMANLRTMLQGGIGDRTLIRMINAGPASHAVHTHGNHMEWLTNNGTVRPAVWKKDILYLRNNLGKNDAIFPFELPPDAYPAVRSGHYPMHLHDEMTQTAGGGSYLFGAMTEIIFI